MRYKLSYRGMFIFLSFFLLTPLSYSTVQAHVSKLGSIEGVVEKNTLVLSFVLPNVFLFVLPNVFLTSLISFNVGIEIVQITIVALVLPALYYISRFVWQKKFISVSSILIGVVGVAWFVQRLFFI